MNERRKYSVRNDLDNLFRDDKGKLSGGKIGTYAGQIISGHLLLAHSNAIIERWDSMAILFLVLIAPEAYKRAIEMKWGGNSGYTEHTETSRRETTITPIDHPPKKEPQ